jgi:hypothetical protein
VPVVMSMVSSERRVEIVEVGELGGKEGVDSVVGDAMFGLVN